MTPQLWEDIAAMVSFNDSYDFLREVGGSMEPLVWDEDYGQGVILRLPWARDGA